VDSRAGLDDMEKKIFSELPGLKPLGRPACSQSLYRLRYPCSWITHNEFCLCFTLWSTDQSSWLQMQRYGFNSRRYQIFCVVVGLERGPLSLVSTIRELLGRTSSGSGLESRDYGRRDLSR
jgi:hypothetical protein